MIPQPFSIRELISSCYRCKQRGCAVKLDQCSCKTFGRNDAQEQYTSITDLTNQTFICLCNFIGFVDAMNEMAYEKGYTDGETVGSSRAKDGALLLVRQGFAQMENQILGL